MGVCLEYYTMLGIDVSLCFLVLSDCCCSCSVNTVAIVSSLNCPRTAAHCCCCTLNIALSDQSSPAGTTFTPIIKIPILP